MRVLVCTGWNPFIRGGNELLADALCLELQKEGHEADVLRIPLATHPKDEIIKSYLACRLLSLSHSIPSIDRVIALKFPAFAVQHPNKVVWLVQQYRQMYDLRGTPYSDLGSTPHDQEVRRAIYQMDSTGIGEATKVLSISQNVANRLKRYNDLDATVLYPPPPQGDAYFHATYGDYILSVGRLDPLKRIDRLVRAMGHVRSQVCCKIVGTGPEVDNLKRQAAKGTVGQRVEFLGSVDDATLLQLYAGALAVYYGPYDEDYGLVTVEAMKSSKPVLTFEDSGGVLEFVHHGETGYVFPLEDSATLLADACDELFENRARSEFLGAHAYDLVAGISWSSVLPELLDE